MAHFKTYHLKPPPGQTTLCFHFGRQGIGMEEASETLGSDSLFAALVTQALLVDAEMSGQALLCAFNDEGSQPPFLLSSLFPRIGNLILLPRPALKLPLFDEALRASIGKGFKKLRYLSPQLFADVCAGRPFSHKPIIMQAGKVWVSHAELPNAQDAPIWTIDAIPHVTVDRVDSTSAYYEVGRVTYAAGAGLGLLVQFNTEDAQATFEHLLTLLGESGLGGRRSSGFGGFSWEHGPDLVLDLGPTGERVLLLSRYVPTDAELPGLRSERAAYQLINVGGWLYSIGVPAQRRQRIRMIAEGSLIDSGAIGRHPRGRLVDVCPDYSKSKRPHPIFQKGRGATHPVYRSGLALSLAIPDEQKEPS